MCRPLGRTGTLAAGVGCCLHLVAFLPACVGPTVVRRPRSRRPPAARRSRPSMSPPRTSSAGADRCGALNDFSACRIMHVALKRLGTGYRGGRNHSSSVRPHSSCSSAICFEFSLMRRVPGAEGVQSHRQVKSPDERHRRVPESGRCAPEGFDYRRFSRVTVSHYAAHENKCKFRIPSSFKLVLFFFSLVRCFEAGQGRARVGRDTYSRLCGIRHNGVAVNVHRKCGAVPLINPNLVAIRQSSDSCLPEKRLI